ncbi:MAG TPA: tyrosine--tRNA ligase [Vicinamibacterales bacterium]|nr:tyrosine--tRNA ligase [Vicinamibacterales bacterium]
MDFFSELTWRGLVYDATEGARDALARESLSAYIGFDPTASSLHVGSLLQMVALAHLQRYGHSPIAVVGGGTGLIGDPSGKTTERALLTPEQVEANVASIRAQLARFLDFERQPNPARIVNNAEWLTRLSAIEFMRDVGKHFSVNAMLTKDSVKRRLEGEEGISYTEFSYSLLQAYDFLELHRRVGCTLQLGGSDQWGNITAGMDLVRRVTGAKVHGLVLPLITTATGAKFGKTEAGTIWLDPSRTSPYEFYQFWVNVDDRDAGRYLRFFTFLERARIEEIEQTAAREPEKRHAQRELAREVTRLVHGADEMEQAERAAEKVFKGEIASMSRSELLQVFASVGSAVIPRQAEGWRLPSLVVQAGLATSAGEATRLIRQRAVHVNGRLLTDEKARVTAADAIEGEFFVVKKGKKELFLLRIEG